MGAAYRDFVEPRGLSAYGLVEESLKIPDAEADAVHPFVWFERRLRDIQDIWHVLTGYGVDTLGEVCVVAFSHAQTGNLGFGAITLSAARHLLAEQR